MKKLNPIHFALPKHISCTWTAFVICMGIFMVGIYKVTSPSKKVYIGQSINIEKRFFNYKGLNCKRQPILYRSLKKYGADKHKFEIICACEISELNDKERYYQDLYSALSLNGMNCKLTKTSDRNGALSEETKLKLSNSKKGKIATEETRLKMSIAHKGNKSMLGKNHSEESKLKISIANKGKIFSDETRKKLSQARKGYTHSAKTRLKIGIASKGKTHSEETRLKLSIMGKGRKPSEATRKKISDANKGHKCSEETRLKISAAAMGHKRNLGSKRSLETIQKIANTKANKIKAIL